MAKHRSFTVEDVIDIVEKANGTIEDAENLQRQPGETCNSFYGRRYVAIERAVAYVGHFLEGCGGKFLDSGSYRSVYKFGRYVVKFEFDCNGSTDIESKVWETVSSTRYSKYFARIHYTRGRFSVMDYVPNRKPDVLFVREVLDNLERELGIYWADVHFGNVRGRKVIDYGNFLVFE